MPYIGVNLLSVSHHECYEMMIINDMYRKQNIIVQFNCFSRLYFYWQQYFCRSEIFSMYRTILYTVQYICITEAWLAVVNLPLPPLPYLAVWIWVGTLPVIFCILFLFTILVSVFSYRGHVLIKYKHFVGNTIKQEKTQHSFLKPINSTAEFMIEHSM